MKRNKRNTLNYSVFYLWVFYVYFYFLFYSIIIQNSIHTLIRIQNKKTCYYTKLNE